ncbi:uncharacterized protein FA14DRAFT_177247 [Meira miltonrushii]|uniref:Uncharacterized protein n=1 Tax=Meira miltonrushii TaxID=1280837 RepID=A0A316VK37_9BASI|nr:uncharacterized protein FA14DRAFT_177247 [Meira miltonrushii]PWN37969.1 hypothetical protein FA14DRAFT_177247 [Meira miltonrushii]
MSKISLFTFVALALFQFGNASDQPIGTTPFPGHRGEGYQIVDTGAIAHCGTNTGQQCIQIQPLDNVSITVPQNRPVESSGTLQGDNSPKSVDIKCQPDGLCVTAFNFDQPGNYSDFLVNCLNVQGEDQGVNVHVFLGRGNLASSAADAYSYFVVSGSGVKAKWENDADYTMNVGLKGNYGTPKPSSKKAETLYIMALTQGEKTPPSGNYDPPVDPGDFGKGTVRITGANPNCGQNNTDYQCFKTFNTISVTNKSDDLFIQCDYSNLCSMKFNFTEKGNKAQFTVNCLNAVGKPTGSYVDVKLFGKKKVLPIGIVYGSYKTEGDNIEAHWGNTTSTNAKRFTTPDDPTFTHKPANELFIDFGQVQVGDHGYRRVDEGAVAHCGTDIGQQCLQIETPLSGVNITNDGNLDIACTPSGVCVFPFNFDTQSANVTINCMGPNTGTVPRNVYARFGKYEIPNNGTTKYAYFSVYGEGISAKWESAQMWTVWVALNFYHFPSKKAETLHMKCVADY